MISNDKKCPVSAEDADESPVAKRTRIIEHSPSSEGHEVLLSVRGSTCVHNKAARLPGNRDILVSGINNQLFYELEFLK